MLDYQTLDTIADSYTPLLAILCLGFLGKSLFKKDFSTFKTLGLFVIYSLVVSYGIMFWDNHFNIWPAFKLDYSTHTAVALSLVVSLCLMASSLSRLWIASLLMYMTLMEYQNYHSLADMLSTALVVAIFLAPITVRILKKSASLKPSKAIYKD